MQTRQQSGVLPATLVIANLIGGEWKPATAGSFSRKSPANHDDVVSVAPVSTRAEVREACERAQSAQRVWARVPAPQRAQVLTRLAVLLADSKESLVRRLLKDSDSPIREGKYSRVWTEEAR